MAGIIYDLIEVLDEQKECYEGLNTLAKYKEEAIVGKDLAFLQEVVGTEEQFIGRLQTLDGKREVLMKDIAMVTGMNFKEVTVSTIIQKIGEKSEVSQTLLALKGGIQEELATLKRQSDLNKELINHSLELVDFMINAIGSTRGYSHVGNYGKPGDDVALQRQQSLFDTKR